MNDTQKMLNSVKYLCMYTDGERGIWKRIDENRELLMFLEERAPEFVERFSFVRGWIGDQDAFLLSLKKLLSLEKTPHPFMPNFPRPWKWEFDSQGLSERWAEASRKNSERCLGEHAKGKD